MASYTTNRGQSVYDVCLQLNGDLTGIFDFVDSNGIQDIGISFNGGEVLEFTPNQNTNATEYLSRGYRFTTSDPKTVGYGDFNEDFNNDFNI